MIRPGALHLTLQFVAQRWAETPFDRRAGVGTLSRASITNTLSGALVGEGVLEYLLAYPFPEAGEVPFVGYERVSGLCGTRQGSLVLRHDGVFSRTAGVRGTLCVVVGSGAQGFAGVAGGGSLAARAGEHGGVYMLDLHWDGEHAPV